MYTSSRVKLLRPRPPPTPFFSELMSLFQRITNSLTRRARHLIFPKRNTGFGFIK